MKRALHAGLQKCAHPRGQRVPLQLQCFSALSFSSSSHETFSGASSPQEALDQLYILKSKEKPSGRWSQLWESFQNEGGSIPVDVEHKLLKELIESKNRKLLERTEQLEWNDPESLRLLIQGWLKVSPQRAARMLLEWPLRQPPTLQSFRLVLMELAREKDSHVAIQIMNLLCEKYPFLNPDRECFHYILTACANSPMAAEDTLSNMIKYSRTKGWNTAPNHASYRKLLYPWAKSNQPGAGQRAYELLKTLPEPDTMCYNYVLNAMANEGEYGLAQELFMTMIMTENIHFDKVTINTVFKAHAKANTTEATEQAQRLLEILDMLPKQSAISGIPEARSFSAVIAMWAKLGVTDRAYGLLKELEERYFKNRNARHLRPDPICYRTVIGSLSKTKDFSIEHAQRAQELLDSMQNLGYPLNLLTCNTVLNCWSKVRKPEEVERLLSKMIQMGLSPDIVSYNTVIQTHARAGNADRPQELLELLLSSSPSEKLPKPNTRTFTSVVTALSRLKKLEAAELAQLLLIKMQELHDDQGLDTLPNIITYNAVLSCWASLGNGPRAEYLLKELSGIEKPTSVSYNTVISAFSNDLAKGEKLVKEMLSKGTPPNNRTLKALLHVLENDDSIEDKKGREEQIIGRFFSKKKKKPQNTE